MMGRVACALIVALVICTRSSAQAPASSNPPRPTATSASGLNVIAYYPMWSVCDLPPQKVDFHAVTHIIWFWGEPTTSWPYFSLTAGSGDSTTLVTGQPGWCLNPLDNGSNGQTHLKIMRDSCRANGVKLIMCVGGEYGNPASVFASMIADPAKQDTFIEAATGFALRNGFDGIDIDWEYPTRGATGRADYTRFLDRLRAKLDAWPQRGLITMALPTWFWWDVAKTDPVIDVATMNRDVDFVDLMEYGLENTGQISHYSPLYPNPILRQESMTDRGVSEYIGAGIARSKMVNLIPFESIRMTDNAESTKVVLGDPGGGASWIGLRDIPAGAITHWDDISKANWAESGNRFYSFENQLSISAKVQYALQMQIGGVGVWELWRGWLPSAPAGQQDPLLQMLKAAVGGFTPPVDSINPTIALTAPANGDSVQGLVTISANASDNVGISRVDFVVSGTVVGTRYAPPFTLVWDASLLSGARSISARAYDYSGNSAVTPSVIVYARPLPPIAPSAWIYQDSLFIPWRDTSWNSSNVYRSTEQVFAGSYSVKSQLGAWGAMSVRSGPLGHPANIDPSQYAALQFAIFNKTPGLIVNVYCYNDYGNIFPSVIQDTLPVNQWLTVSVPISSLDPSGYIIHRVNIQNFTRLNATYYVDNVHFVAAAQMPQMPHLSAPPPGAFVEADALDLTWLAAANADQYQVQLAGDPNFVNLVVNTTTTATSAHITSIPSFLTYYWRVRGVNGAGWSDWSDTRSVLYSNQVRWRMVSIPSTPADARRTTIFPTSFSAAFAYSPASGYIVRDVLRSGEGYWMRFGPDRTMNLAGAAPVSADTVDLVKGWNLIGTISAPVPVALLGSIPPGITTTRFFSYTNTSYEAADTLAPGLGYWVRSDIAAKLVIASGLAGMPKETLHIIDDGDTPPPPPDAYEAKPPIPSTTALLQNYPNPFNPSTVIRFDLHEPAHVRLSVYDLLGREVARLIDGERPGGTYAEPFNPAKLASGLYFYRLTAGAFSEVRKMLYVR